MLSFNNCIFSYFDNFIISILCYFTCSAHFSHASLKCLIHSMERNITIARGLIAPAWLVFIKTFWTSHHRHGWRLNTIMSDNRDNPAESELNSEVQYHDYSIWLWAHIIPANNTNTNIYWYCWLLCFACGVNGFIVTNGVLYGQRHILRFR